MKVFVLDCGRNSSTIYDAEKDESRQIAQAEVLALPDALPNDCLVICEKAHLGVPRTKKSRSQPFTAKELSKLYQRLADKNITLRLFPQMSTPNACSYSGLAKSDLNDPKSIYIWWKDHPNISMEKPENICFDEDSAKNKKRKASHDYKADTDSFINEERRKIDDSAAYSRDNCSKWIRKNLNTIADGLSEEARRIFKLTDEFKYKKNCATGKKGEYKLGKTTDIKLGALYSIICTLINSEGKIRIRPETGNMPGWPYIKQYILKFTPFHQRGGVARSNLWWHTFRSVLNEAGKKHGLDYKRKVKKYDPVKDTWEDKTIRRGDFTPEEDAFFLQERRIFAGAVAEVWKLAKKMIEADPSLKLEKLEEIAE